MNVNEILLVEKEGIINTINDYTREHFIRNYTTILHKVKYPEDKEQILLITYRLIDWYEENLESILNNQYVNNKHEHTKSIKLLKELANHLK